MTQPVYELAQVVSLYKALFIEKHSPLKHHLSVLSAIEHCRTAALGGHVDACDSCGHLRISYNSCRNRHCPKCQNTNREKWIEQQHQNLLPVTYFHVVFTLPGQLNSYCLKHPELMYNLLFHSGKATIEAFAHNEKHLGAQPGMISVLHTWGQNLSLHPHVHMIVPGGGFTEAGYWKPTKSKGRYLYPVKAMSKVFRAKYVAGLRGTFTDIPKALYDQLFKKDWVVYCKRPFMGPQQVIEYLGRYTHKIAISNHRIKSIEDSEISFSYKDYADGSKQKLMTLEAGEFLRRFCMHLLPRGFRKIRHYGFLANRAKPRLKMEQMKMGILQSLREKKDWKQIALEKLGFDVDQCPCCKKGRMQTIMQFEAHGPPLYLMRKIKEQNLNATVL